MQRIIEKMKLKIKINDKNDHGFRVFDRYSQ